MLFKVINNHLFLLIYILCVQAASPYNSSFTRDHLRYLKNETRELFRHAWTSYMTHGFPHDEVRPLSCEPYGPDYNDVMNTVRNDAMANISSTVLDNLDTLIILEQWDDLDAALSYLKANQEGFFNRDTIVQVFEATIRFLGGLMSAHLILVDVLNKNITLPARYHRLQMTCANYDGFLLEMAHDLGSRLITSYKTRTNIPVPRVNLAKGLKSVPPSLQKDACTSGITTPVLEFTLLSRLTGDYQFEYYSQVALWKIWQSRSVLNLLPMTIDPILNQWKDSVSGIGASIDSFYEYAAKGAILFNDNYMWSIFKTSYQALLTHSAQIGAGSMIFPNVGTQDGMVFSDWIDSLSAFWSGLQVLTGQLTDAIKTHVVYMKIWDYFDSIPERWIYAHHNNKNKKKVFRAEDSIELEWYPLRPEFIESTYYLYRATRDPMYLQIGERVLNLFDDKFKAPCGFSGFQDVRTGSKQNRMETFVMGETLKYLYLLFDVDNDAFLHDPELMRGKNWVFSTEAHPLWYHEELRASPKKGFVKSKPGDDNDDHDDKLFSTPINRNITMPQPLLVGIPDENNVIGHVTKKDPFASRFDTCETNPFTTHARSFQSSGYYDWAHLFNADFAFRNSLKKPNYRKSTNLDGSYFELSKDFFQKFTLFDSPLTCRRPPTTTVLEIFWGDVKLASRVEISELVADIPANQTSLIYSGDLWIPNLQGLRVLFEELKVGSVDTRNEVITSEYMNSLFGDDGTPSTTGTTSRGAREGLRVKKVNGIETKAGAIIWTMPFVVTQNEESTVAVTEEGRVVIEGKVIENLFVWYG